MYMYMHVCIYMYMYMYVVISYIHVHSQSSRFKVQGSHHLQELHLHPLVLEGVPSEGAL